MAERNAVGTPMDRYVVLEYLAEGGMGAIYLGKKLGAGGFEKEVVLKQLLPEFTQQPEFIDLFLREARLSATLDHANIVHTIDLVRAGDEYFIVMEYVRGGDLRTLLKRAKRRKRRLRPQAGIFIAREILSALAYAHAKLGPDGRPLGLIHRDVSPSNILVSGTGEVKLTDFGIAKASTHRSIFYRVKGKVGYMSPEQARGEPLDPRSDLYSVAVCLYEMLTGERLFVQAGLTTSAEDLYKQPVPAVSRKRPDLPKDLDKVMFKALSVDPDGRYQTAGEFQEALLRCAHRNGLMTTAAELARHLVEVCGPVEEWGTTHVKEIPQGTEAYSLGQGPSTDKLRLTELLDDGEGEPHSTQALPPEERGDEADDSDAQPLDGAYVEESDSDAEIDGEWAAAARARPGHVRPSAGEARRRVGTHPGRLTGLELTSIINGMDLAEEGARPLVDVSTPPRGARSVPVTSDTGSRAISGTTTSSPPVLPKPIPSPRAPTATAVTPPDGARPTTTSPLLPTDRVAPVEPRAASLPVWAFILIFLFAGVGIVFAIGFTGPDLEPPTLAGAVAAGGEAAGSPVSPAPVAAPTPVALPGSVRDPAPAPAPSASPPASPVAAKLTIHSIPSGATVSIGDRQICTTPCTHDTLGGSEALAVPIVVKVEKRGFLPWTTLVDLNQVAHAQRSARLRKAPHHEKEWGRLQVESSVPAEILVNGEKIGHVTSEGPVLLPPGKIRLTLLTAAGATRDATAEIVAGETRTVRVVFP